MADTKRNLDAFNNASTGLLKDNSAQAISAQDLRDQVLSAWVPYVTAKTDDYAAVHGDLVVMTLSGTNKTVTLAASPAASDRVGVFFAAQTGSETVTVDGNGNDINGAATITLDAVYDCVVLEYDLAAAEWRIVSDTRASALLAKLLTVDGAGSGMDADLLDGNDASAFAASSHTHSEYLNKDGSVALTGNWDAGSFEVRAETFESDVTTGTAPLTVASTTKVTNLNADMLDDQSGAYYLDSANFTGANWTDLTDAGATTLHKHDHGGLDGLADDDHTQYLLADGTRALSANWDAGSVEIRAETFESDVATGTSPFTVASTTAVTNLNADLLDGNHAAAFQSADATLTALAGYNTNGLLTQTAADTFAGRTITGTANEISVADGDGVSGNPTLSLPATIDLGGKTSLEIPNGTSPTVDAAGEIAIDTDADGNLIDQGLIVYHDGTQKMFVVAVDALPSTDDHVLAYDATADKFVFQAQSGGGGTPGGSDAQVQFNDGGSAFGGDSGLTYNKTTNQLSVDILALPTTSSTAGILKLNSNRFLHAYGTSNVFLGDSSGNFTLTGTRNIAVGTNSLQGDTSGSDNFALGTDALKANTTGSNSVALGSYTLLVNTTGTGNIAIGDSAMISNTTGYENVSIGSSSGRLNTSGIQNTYIGNGAGYSVTTGQENTAVGYYAGQSSTGSYNTSIGLKAGFQAGSGCVCIGWQAGVSETGSNKLHIANTYDQTLIYGDFSTGTVRVGVGAKATNATDGFLYIPTCAGTPTGTPTTHTGYCPIIVDTTNNKLYFYSGGAWRDAGP